MADNTRVKLIHCPFCGHDALLGDILYHKNWIITCNVCSLKMIQSYSDDTKENMLKQIIKKWNTRYEIRRNFTNNLGNEVSRS
jgi:hypothetical protein